MADCVICGRRTVQDIFNPAKLPPERRARAARALRPRVAGQSVLGIILGVVAFFAAPLVWGILGILLGLLAYSRRPGQKLAVAAIVVGVLGTVVGTVLHHAHPFGY